MEIVSINLENEMDLILSHKRTMKLGELCGFSIRLQTIFATAVSEISRCVIGDKCDKSVLRLSIVNVNAGRKNLVATISTRQAFGQEHESAIQYAKRLTKQVQVIHHNQSSEVVLIEKIKFSGLINKNRIDEFTSYFKKELPLSPYDELRKKNILLLELTEKLSESETQYKTLTETLPLMMFTANPAGYITYANKWLKDYFNLPDVQAAKVSWQSLLHPSDNKSAREEWERAISTGSQCRTQGKLKPKSQDEALWHLISIKPVKNETGQLMYWTGFFVDIHAQKLVEETLKNNSELLLAQKQLLNSRKNLEEKIRELNKSNHDLEQFAYIASHDLQEPLRKIRSFTELLEKNLDDRPKARKFLEKIDSSASRMSDLIRGVLNYSRLSKPEIAMVPTDLGVILDSVRQDVELVIEEKKAQIDYSGMPVILAIPQQIHQLFYNLISNSLKFTLGRPEIRITAEILSPEKTARFPELLPSGNYAMLKFTDNGIGFEQKNANDIFTIFKRLNSRETFEGTGIGLALCKKIVDNHYGLISAESTPGRGTTFTVILPVN